MVSKSRTISVLEKMEGLNGDGRAAGARGMGSVAILLHDCQNWKNDLLALWKDADPDIPIPKQAKAEYAFQCLAID